METGNVVFTLGFVSEVEPVKQSVTETSGRPYTLRVVKLVAPDHLGRCVCVSLTLWGRKAILFNGRGRVLAVRGAKVKEYEGVKELSLTHTGTVEVGPKEAGVEEMEAWGKEQEAWGKKEQTEEVEAWDKEQEEWGKKEQTKEVEAGGKGQEDWGKKEQMEEVEDWGKEQEAWEKEQTEEMEAWTMNNQLGRKTVSGRVRPGKTSSFYLRSLGRYAGVAKKKLVPFGVLVNRGLSILPKKNIMCDVENGVKIVVSEPKSEKYWTIRE